MSSNPYDFSASDVVVPSSEADLVMRSIFNATVAGVVAYDDNTGPEAGQIVYMTFDLGYLEEEVGRQLVENSMAYLLAREAPGNASISGTVTLSDSEDASGVTVTLSSGETTITGPGGQYILTGLHGSTYTISATLEGYGPAETTLVLGPDEAATGVDLVLSPIVQVSNSAQPEVSIPDFDEDGVSSIISVVEEGQVNNLNIDINIEHPSIGQLVVTITSPRGTIVTLHNQTGATADDIIGNWPGNLLVDGPGTLDDFLMEQVQGDWTLHVADLGFGAWGTFHSWALNLAISQDNLSPVDDQLPAATRLVGNIPNPFNPKTVINFELHTQGTAVLSIFDIRGHQVKELLRQDLAPGRHEVVWDGRDSAGRAVASGLYFSRLQAGGVQELLKMTLVR